MNFTFDIDLVKEEFSQIIKLKNNSRILFSGKFGLGKTYFLNDFFGKSNEEYFSLHLYPVNYQIQENNRDIVDLIKYDIIFELIKLHPDAFKNEINIRSILKAFFRNFDKSKFSKKAMEGMVELIPVYGKILGKPFIDSFNIEQMFNEVSSDLEHNVDLFIKEIKAKGLRESDLISNIINIKINELKEDKKSVLIIDDFDRMEPNHIFRVFNILSSFFDANEKNIFGFDKIIIVADYYNLKSIFHHLYGKETDFSGYIDKFFSTEPYRFNNSNSILISIDSIFNHTINNLEKFNDAFGARGRIKFYLVYFLSKSIENGFYNLRELLKITKNELKSLKGDDFFYDSFSNSDIIFVNMLNVTINILISIFSSKEKFLEIINKLIEKPELKKKMYLDDIYKLNDIMIKVLGYLFNKAELSLNKSFVIKRLNNEEELVFEEYGEKMFLTLLRDYVEKDKYILSYYEYEDMRELFVNK